DPAGVARPLVAHDSLHQRDGVVERSIPIEGEDNRQLLSRKRVLRASAGLLHHEEPRSPRRRIERRGRRDYLRRSTYQLVVELAVDPESPLQLLLFDLAEQIPTCVLQRLEGCLVG